MTPDRSDAGNAPVSLAQRAASSRFKTLYRDGMALVEEVAAYLDGRGRQEAKDLPRHLAVAYAAESMRLTTRLMQIASWLLVEKAALEDGSQGRAGPPNKVKLTAQGIASQATIFKDLPEMLQDLTARSLQIQSQLIRYDAQIHPDVTTPVPNKGLGIKSQLELLRRNFQAGAGSR